MGGVTHLSDSRPSQTAARAAQVASGVALLALLLTPLAALGRTFDGAPVLLHLFGGLLNLSATPDIRLPASGPTQMLGLTSFALLLATFVGALGRQKWFWLTGLLSALAALLAVVLLGPAVLTTLRRALRRATITPATLTELEGTAR